MGGFPFGKHMQPTVWDYYSLRKSEEDATWQVHDGWSSAQKVQVGDDDASELWCARLQKITMGQAKRSVFMVCRRTKATRCSYFVYHFWHGASRCISVSYWLVLTLKYTFFSSTCMYQHLHCTGWILDDLLWRLPFFLGWPFNLGESKSRSTCNNFLLAILLVTFLGWWFVTLSKVVGHLYLREKKRDGLNHFLGHVLGHTFFWGRRSNPAITTWDLQTTLKSWEFSGYPPNALCIQ